MSFPIPTPRQLVAARRALSQVQARCEPHETRHGPARLRWRRWGEGPPLVLLHGGHGSWMHWVRNIEALSRHASVWLPDMPGFGDSDALAGHPHDPQRQAHLVAALDEGLRQLLGPGARFDLGGFSFGGFVATQLAAVNPNVRRLALVGAAGHGGARRQASEMVNWRLTHGPQRWQAHVHNLRALMLHDPRAIDAQALVAHACASNATRYRSKSISRAGGLADTLAGFDRDLLMVWGEHDVTAHPQEIGAALQDGRANRHLRIVADAGHWVQYERSEATNAILAQWFAPQGTALP